MKHIAPRLPGLQAVALLLAAGLLLSGAREEIPPPGGPQRPNILFVMPDQFRRQAIGFMNEDPVKTPHLDAFAEEAQVFTNAVSSVPICTPYRGMLMTGRYPLSTGMTVNSMAGLDQQLSKEEITLSDVWKNNGYQTGYIGKWHLERPTLNETKHPRDNATAWDAWTPPGPRRHGLEFWYAYNVVNNHFHPHYWKDTPEKIRVDEWSVRHETDMAIRFIENRSNNQPFALMLSWNPPHTPFEAPEEYEAMYEDKKLPVRANVRRKKARALYEKAAPRYFAAVSSVDANFGRLLQALEEEQIADNTIVVFTSDHGEMLGSHGEMHKTTWYAESIGIPFLIRWPGRIEAGRQALPLSPVDLMPTLLGLMNLPTPEAVKGDDYSGVLTGDKRPGLSKGDSSAFIAFYPGPGPEHKMAIGQKPHPWAQYHFSIAQEGIDWRRWGYRGIRTKRYTYVVDRAPEGIGGVSWEGWTWDHQPASYSGSTEMSVTRLLYDNEEDPYQLRPVRAQHASENPVMRRLEKKLRTKLDEMNDLFPLQ